MSGPQLDLFASDFEVLGRTYHELLAERSDLLDRQFNGSADFHDRNQLKAVRACLDCVSEWFYERGIPVPRREELGLPKLPVASSANTMAGV